MEDSKSRNISLDHNSMSGSRSSELAGLGKLLVRLHKQAIDAAVANRKITTNDTPFKSNSGSK